MSWSSPGRDRKVRSASRPGPGPIVASRIFLISPASLDGVRGGRILDGSSRASFTSTLHEGGAVPLGEVYAFISSLYYRGKRAYARAFGHHPDGGPVALTITPTQGLVADETRVTLDELREFASCDIDPGNPRYRTPLAMSARGLDQELPRHVELVLLGSIATGKYLDPLAEVFGRRLLIPRAFVGRGDMSRGGLMLRAADAGKELEYVPALDAERTGPRPPVLDREPPS